MAKARVVIYERARGKKLEELIAYMPESQDAIKDAADKLADVAQATLSAYRATARKGSHNSYEEKARRSRIERSKGDLDEYVDLVAPGSPMVIELGRSGGRVKNKSGNGKWIDQREWIGVAPLRTALASAGSRRFAKGGRF